LRFRASRFARFRSSPSRDRPPSPLRSGKRARSSRPRVGPELDRRAAA
jgi:hypothetical protein